MQLRVMLNCFVQSRLHAGFLFNIVDHRKIEKGAGAHQARPAERAPKGASSSIARPSHHVELGAEVELNVVDTIFVPLRES